MDTLSLSYREEKVGISTVGWLDKCSSSFLHIDDCITVFDIGILYTAFNVTPLRKSTHGKWVPAAEF